MQLFKKENILFILNIFLLIIIFFIDLVFPSKIFIWLLYLIPVLITSVELSKKHNTTIATAVSSLILIGFMLSFPQGTIEIVSFLTAALLIIGLVWITVYIRMQSRESSTSLESMTHLLEAVFDHTHIPMAHLSINYDIIKVNEAFANYDEHQIWLYSNKNYFDAFPEDESFKECFEKVVATGKSYSSNSTEIKRKIIHNKVTYWSWQVFPVNDSEENVNSLILAFNPITEQAEVERKLRENQVRLNGIISSAMDAIISIDSEQKVILFNTAAEKMFKISAEDAVGKHIGLFIPKEFRKVHKEHIKAFGKTNISTRSMNSLGKIYALRMDGNVFPAEASISQVDVNGQKIYSVILRDITERVRNEEQNQLQKDRALFLSEITKLLSEYTVNYFDALNLAGKRSCEILGDFCGIQILKDDNGNQYETIIHFKDETESNIINSESDLLLIKPEALNNFKAQNQILIKHVSDNGILTPELLAKLEEKKLKTFIIVPIISLMQFLGVLIISKKDDLDFIDINEESFLSEYASRIGLHVVNSRNYAEKNREIEERKKIQENLISIKEELERSNKELENFAYIASHDLQEPLRMVVNYVELLQRRYKDKLDNDASEFIHYAVDGAKRMQRFIKDLLEFSRVTSKAKKLTNVDLNEIIDEILHDLQIVIEETGTKIIYDELPEITADASQMKQLFQNLISNAIKFRTERSPEIKITFEEINRFYKFSVKDNGTGIDPKYKDDIFAIFKRAHDGKFSGTGIGLAVCKKIVELHEGKIWYESNLGEGTEFFFTVSKNIKSELSE